MKSAGGGINAVTRSGSNQFHGTGYFFDRNEQMVGKGPLDRSLAPFTNKQYGASLGGPIFRDRAFFFVTGEKTKRESPSGFSVSGNSGQAFGHQAEIQRIADILNTRYGFDPGYNYYYGDGYLYRVDPATMLISQVVSAILR